MSPYKAFLNSTRQYFNTVPILRFLLSIYIVVFAVGAGLFVLGSFFLLFFGEFLTCIGIVLMLTGLLLTIIKEDDMVLLIVSGATAVGSLAAWIVTLARFGGYAFGFTSFFYFLAFGAITALVLIKSEKFVQMRAASAARAQMAGVACPRCGAFVSMNAAFCPSCGAQNPAVQQYAPPAQPQYAPPAPVAEPQATAAAKCVSCGEYIPAGAAFCAKCGAKQ